MTQIRLRPASTSACIATMLAALLTFISPHAMSEPTLPTETAADPFAWLEDVQGERALNWVRERNALTQKELSARPEFDSMREQLLDVLNAKDRIPGVSRQGHWFYNLWQDENHKRGLWRRTTLEEYRKAEPAWETVLDLDALGQAEGENWVWAGASPLAPNYRYCLVALSRGGADAHVVREFDTVKKEFVANGFSLPEAKSDVDWIDEDHIYVGTDFGVGSLTDSGYPRVIKRWKRGTPLSEAVTVFEGEAKDVSVRVSVDKTPGFERTVFSRSTDFYNSIQFLLQGDKQVKLDVPSDASVGFDRDIVLLQLRSDFKAGKDIFPSGSLIYGDAKAYLIGERKLKAMFTPTATRSLSGYTTTQSHVLLSILDNVAGKLEQWQRKGSSFVRKEIQAPYPGTLGIGALHDPQIENDPLAESYVLTYTDFLTPNSLYLGDTATDKRELLKARRVLFDATGMRAEQRTATSKDGTKVPYFVIWPKGATPDGNNPTLLYGYGGFDISLRPSYSGTYGRAWHKRGGVVAIANIRGGGEFGPNWHKSAIKAEKQRSYDDFISIAEDLIAAKITSPKHLGIMGGSNGGLLMGATFTQRPDLFNAVVCQVPLLDMRRYHTLLAGASWMAEYGNPDVAEEWAYISKYSPYQNVKAEGHYPRVLFTTSTRDDRVHPAHARKMAAKMLSLNHDVMYYENIEGGHGGAADNEQRAYLQALEYTYLWQQLGRPAPSAE